MDYIKVKELFKITKGKKVEEIDYKNENSIRYIQIDDLRNNNNIKHCENINKYVIAKKEDIIIAWDGANAGTIGFGIEGAIGSTLAILRKEDKEMDTEFCGLFLRSKSTYLREKCTGATIPHIQRTALEDIKIPKVSLNKQVEIKNIINKSQELIDKRKEQIKDLDELVKSQFIEMFGDPGINPKGWEVNTLNGISLRKGEYGSGSPSIDYIEGNPRYIRITDINDSGYLNENKVTVENLDEYEKYKLNDGDILFARTGATVGKSFRYKEIYGECLFAGYLIRFIPNKKVVNPDFIYSFTKTNYYENWVQSKQRVVAQPNINAKQYGEELKIFVPPIELQNQFANFVKQVDKLKFEMENSLKELEDNFNSLMQRAFKGELIK